MAAGISRKDRLSPSARRWMAMVAAVCLLVPAGLARGRSDVETSITAPLETAIEVRQTSQKELDQWEKERTELQVQYERLLKENEQLMETLQTLSETKNARLAAVESLEARKRESFRMSREIFPFLENAVARLADRIQQGAPFLQTEREDRLQRLREVMGNVDAGVAVKFRKVMEALFAEAEYGTTIEVYQEKILLDGNELLGNVFRLGRISLFFQTLDRSTAAVYSVADKKWQPLDSRYGPAIGEAMEMGMKRRPIELLSLPVGRLAVQ